MLFFYVVILPFLVSRLSVDAVQLDVCHIGPADNEPQDTVLTSPLSHALYLTIWLRDSADFTECVKSVASIEDYIAQISTSSEIETGVGLGEEKVWTLNLKEFATELKDFSYTQVGGQLNNFPYSGGDIFVHAKSDDQRALEQLAQLVLANMPEGSVARNEVVFGWVYKEGRDLSGFIDGINNPKTFNARCQAAVDPVTGGSYVITQRWMHNFTTIKDASQILMEGWVGRTLENGTVLNPIPKSAHVARLRGMSPIFRQSQPWGELGGVGGLFFIAYSNSPSIFVEMLNRMSGVGKGQVSDSLLLFTKCTSGTMWYFPSKQILQNLAQL